MKAVLLILASLITLSASSALASYNSVRAMEWACRWCNGESPDYDACWTDDCLHFVSQILQHGCMGVCGGYFCHEAVDPQSSLAMLDCGGQHGGPRCLRCDPDYAHVFRPATMTNNVRTGLPFFLNSSYWVAEGPFSRSQFISSPNQGGPQVLALTGDVVIWTHGATSCQGHAVWVASDELNAPHHLFWLQCHVAAHNSNHCPPYNSGIYGCLQENDPLQIWLHDMVVGLPEWYRFYLFHRVDAPPLPGEEEPQGLWTPDHGVYEVTQTLHVLAGTTLEMLPGVHVRFAPGTSIIVDQGGALKVTGTTGGLIVFDARDEGAPWGCVQVRSTNPNNRLLNLVVRNGTNGIIVVDGYADIDHCYVENCAFNGIAFQRSSGSITNSVILDNGWRGVYVIRSSVDMSDNWIWENGGVGVRFWGNGYSRFNNNLVSLNGTVQPPLTFPFFAGVEVLEGDLSMSCNAMQLNAGPGLALLPQTHVSMAYNTIAENMGRLGQGIAVDNGELLLAGGLPDMECGANTIANQREERRLIAGLFADLPAPGWGAEYNYWGETDGGRIMERMHNTEPDIFPLLENALECEDPGNPYLYCPETPEDLLFRQGWNAERAGQFDAAVIAYEDYMNQYPDGKYITEATDRVEFCKKAEGYTWSEIRTYFLDLAADSSKESALVMLCRSNAAWCLAEMEDYNGAYDELDALLDQTDEDYLQLTISLKMLLAQMEDEEFEYQTSPSGKRSLRTTDDHAILAMTNAWDRTEARLDSLFRHFRVKSAPAASLPTTYALSCYPNPFNPSTVILFELPQPGLVSLRVYNLLGREVSVLKDGYVKAGTHQVMFDGSGLASGIYFARLDAQRFSQTKKLMLLK